MIRRSIAAALALTLSMHAFAGRADDRSSAGASAAAQPDDRSNPYLKNVDAEIADPVVRAAIRRVQPACVRLVGGSGVNVAAAGRVLTAGHVAGRLKARCTVEFPDGRRFEGECTALERRLDLALIDLSGGANLPFATPAEAPPEEGTRVVCIGQPAPRTPEGEPTDHQPFHVSTGEIRGFLNGRLGNQALGRTKHDAFTYWGHSGSPLFNERGQIVAMHNSWDPKTSMRHAVTFEAIEHFLKQHLADPDGEAGEE